MSLQAVAVDAPAETEAPFETAPAEWCLTIDFAGDFALRLGDTSPPLVASRPNVHLLFDGVLYDRAQLAAALNVPAELPVNDAELVLLAYDRYGPGLLERVRGAFALVIWDGAARCVYAARDPIGVHPLFYANADGRLIFSVSPERVVRAPGVSTRLNELAMADWLCHRWPDPEETFFAAVKRVRPGYLLWVRHDGPRMDRYWDPAPPGGDVRWLGEDDLDGFDDRFSQAIARSMSSGPTGIFLSGGLDSVSVAAVATDLARRRGGPAPRALSLAFPGDECNEASVQASVASQLGLRQTLLPFDLAVGPRGLLQAALDIGRTWPQPMMNAWNPAYLELGSRGARQGCRSILTGCGGDEWLTVSSYHTADLIGSLDVAGLVHMLSSIRRSYRFSWRNILKATLWVYGVRPWLTIGANAIAPQAVHRSRVRRLTAKSPDWVAPRQDVRRAIHERAERTILPPRPEHGFYLREMRQSLEHPLQAIEMEDSFAASRRTGASVRHPFWDPDLVDMMFRVPPRLLNRGGRTKALVRDSIARRFPDLGFEKHRKVFAFDFFSSVVRTEGPGAWQRLGGPKTLSDLGVLDYTRASSLATGLFSSTTSREMYRVWDILHLEAWARNRG